MTLDELLTQSGSLLAPGRGGNGVPPATSGSGGYTYEQLKAMYDAMQAQAQSPADEKFARDWYIKEMSRLADPALLTRRQP